ncbi:MAG: S8 family peptidase [Patescibacteria group bacterium]
MRYRFFSRAIIAAASAALIPSLVLAQTPNDPRYAEQQWYLDAIHAPAAWDVTTGSSSVIVAVLDTGLDLTHEDIADNLWVNTKEIFGNDIDDDANGFVDDVNGWDFIDGDNDPSPSPVAGSSEDAISHGTLIAGEIGAVGDNHLGISGVNWSVKIMPVRMLDDQGGGTEYDAANAIRYAVRNGAKVINLSFAGNEAHAALQSAVKDAFTKGVVIVAAMGNDARDTNANPVYPACLRTTDEDWVIGVTAIDETDRGASFTNYGTICADVAAPGTNVYGLAYHNVSAGYADLYQGGWSGTSMASPLVAGAAALLFSRFPSLSAANVRNILKLSVDPVNITGFTSGQLGAGRLNIDRALAMASSYAPAVTVDTSAPTASEPSTTGSEPAKSDVATGSDDVLRYSFAVFGAPSGVAPEVDVRRADGSEYARFAAYSSNFRGGVHVATINNDHDGIPEIVTGAGESGGPHVRVFKAFGSVDHEFFAYDKASSHGVSVAVGDINGDGEDDIVTAVGEGVSQDIVTWSEGGEEIFRFPASVFPVASALSVSTADIDEDPADEVVVSGLIDGVIHVAVYDNDGRYLVDFVPFPSAAAVSVSAGDRDGNLIDDIFVSNLSSGNTVNVVRTIGSLVGVFTLQDQAPSGTATVGTDLDLDGWDDMMTMENVDAGLVTLTVSDGKTVLGSWHAPTFGSTSGAFFAGW